jgi:MOB kinase activator 1
MAEHKQTEAKKRVQDSPIIAEEERVRRSISRFEQATLHNVELKSVIRAANGVPHEAWIAMKFRDVFDDLHAVVSMMQQPEKGRTPLCTTKTCCEAKVFRHIWAMGPKRERQQVSPPEYITLLMDWVRTSVLRDDVKPSLSDTKRIMNRLLRVYVHYYSCHGSKFAEYGIEAHMNYSFKHFLYFAAEYDFCKEEEFEPIRPIVDQLMRNARTADGKRERPFDPPGRTPRDEKEQKAAALRDANMPLAHVHLRKAPVQTREPSLQRHPKADAKKETPVGLASGNAAPTPVGAALPAARLAADQVYVCETERSHESKVYVCVHACHSVHQLFISVPMKTSQN